MEFTAQNTNDLARQVYPALKRNGTVNQSRNGPVLRFPGVTTITVLHPWECVNFSPTRDANPFFHLIEALAMMVDFNSVELFKYYAKNMANFTDNGETYNAFYGTRSRKFKSTNITTMDQLRWVIGVLMADPSSRQALVQIWDPTLDLGQVTKDKACNLCLLFEIDQGTGRLNMTTFNRSNDAIWGGVTGANMVHLPMFQQYVAAALSLEIGVWHHSSANLHVYLDNPKWAPLLAEAEEAEEVARGGPLSVYPAPYPAFCPLMPPGADTESFDKMVLDFLNRLKLANRTKYTLGNASTGFAIIDTVAEPMAKAFTLHKLGLNFDQCVHPLLNVPDCDWIAAGKNWLARRHAKKG